MDINKPYATAIPADSVGVQIPPYIPPKIITGIRSAKKESLNANSIFGDFGIQNAGTANNTGVAGENFRPIDRHKAVTKQGLWSRIRAFLFQEVDLTAPIKVELTPYQQKVEDEINDFLHQEVSFKGISKFFGYKI